MTARAGDHVTSGPEVTVIVVSYNHASFVTETLDSIRAQTYAPSRVIVVDDASTDSSAEVIAEWVARNGGADIDLVMRAENQGLCRNLNDALATVDTSLYAYVSADDRMLPHRLELQVDRWVAGGGTAAAVYSDAHVIDEDGASTGEDWSQIQEWSQIGALEGRDLFDDLLKFNWIPAVSVLLNTEAVRAVGCYDDALFYEDHDLWLRLSRYGEILCVREPLVEFRGLTSSLGSTHFHRDDARYQAASLHILLKNYGYSAAGDEHLREVMPVLAIRLWSAGVAPDLVGRALALTARGRSTPGLTVRRLLLRAGVKREPALLRAARDRLRA
ncbi:glycosyltransferase [Nocardioides zhouii]|uniref:glycosyltransferase n=1 Tax=Nocardioides zhouii TaxID=1168729 RepID=UPI0026CD8BD0